MISAVPKGSVLGPRPFDLPEVMVNNSETFLYADELEYLERIGMEMIEGCCRKIP